MQRVHLQGLQVGSCLQGDDNSSGSCSDHYRTYLAIGPGFFQTGGWCRNEMFRSKWA